MNFIKKYEIFPQNPDLLKKHLHKELVEEKKYRNKPDHHIDQTQFFESYYNNSYIPKDLMSQMIKESESVQESFNNFTKKSKFLDINSIYSNESQKQFFFLLYYDVGFSDMKIVKFSLEENNSFTLEIELIDFEEFSFKFDSTIRNIVQPYEQKINEQSRVYYTDLYSLYSNVFTFYKNRIDTKEFCKIKTFDSPNIFLSQIFLNHFFNISKNGTINIFDENLKNYSISLKDEMFRKVSKGIFFNHTHLLLLHNKDFFGLLDLRNKDFINEKQLINNNNLFISDIRHLNSVNFVIYSTNTIYLYDVRNSSLPVSEKSLNLNFKELELKSLFKTGNDLFDENVVSLSSSDYLGVDKTGKDNSVMYFTQKEELNKKPFFQNFIDFSLINTDCKIHDSSAFSFKDNFYIFTVDDFGGLNYHIYEKNRSNKMSQTNENVQMNSEFEEIRALFEENNVKRLFSNNAERVKGTNVFYENKNNSENDLDNSDIDENIYYDDEEPEDEEESLNFGKLKINGEDQKIYEIDNKREVLQKISNYSKDDLNSNDTNINLQQLKDSFQKSNDENDKNPYLKYLLDNYNK